MTTAVTLKASRVPRSPSADAGADAAWTAVVGRDASADGRFVYAVRTTGVYCYPSCKARTPRRENVSFHATPAEARAAGFRACKRCRPDEPPRSLREAEIVAAACRTLSDATEAPALADLARAAGLSPFHFHRLFKRVTGLTPRGWAAARRAERIAAELSTAQTVTGALYEAGYGSASRFYETATRRLGMTPDTARRGGSGETIAVTMARSSLGQVLVAATAQGVCALLIGEDAAALRADLVRRFPKALIVDGDATFAAVARDAVAAVAMPEAARHLPLDVRGTAFQERVWQELRNIPAGETVTYAELARRIGKPEATRAVASACGANPVAVVIPCHRVVRGDGSLGGYRWGLEHKQALLTRERKA